MLPRRISLHLHQQNWLAVFIDLIIVVAGIFIALQVSQWHNKGQENTQRLYLLQKLAGEITQTLEENKEYTKYYEADKDNYTTLIRILTEKPENGDTSEQFFNAYASIFHLPDASFNSPTFDYIINAGKLNVLGNNDTQNKFLDVNAWNTALKTQQDINQRLILPVIANIMGNVIKPEDIEGVSVGSEMHQIYQFSELPGNIIMIRNLNGTATKRFLMINEKLATLLSAIQTEIQSLKK
ncbi:MAG: hypothetical protein SWN10_03740 [Pseudomonadota bacterium]|nr:hypothetical protein [Pseudomonadota bacterium]